MIFISYSWANASAVQLFRNELALANIPAWIDYERLDLNMRLDPQIRSAVLESSVLIVADSFHARLSRWVRKEVDWAERFMEPTLRVKADQLSLALKFPSAKCTGWYWEIS